MMAGLLDQYTLAGNQQAFEMVKAMAAWTKSNVESVLARGGQRLWQDVLDTEWGGMNEFLYNLFAITGNPDHFTTAAYFNHWLVYFNFLTFNAKVLNYLTIGVLQGHGPHHLPSEQIIFLKITRLAVLFKILT